MGCLVPAIVLFLLIVGGGFVAHRFFGFDFRKFLPQPRPDVEIIDPSKDLKDEPKTAPKPVEEKPVVEETTPEPPPPPPRKTPAQLKAEADEAQRALDQEIATARQANAARALKGFAGVRFGEAVKGTPISLELLPEAKGDEKGGFSYLMFGPRLKKPFRKFGVQPMVRVTPATRRIFRIEFSQTIARAPEWTYNPETTNLVAMLEQHLGCKAYSLDREHYPLANHTFVFPLGETTVTVAERGGTQLQLVFEHAGLKADARTESESVRKEELAEKVDAKTLRSDKYPNGGMVKFGRARMKDGTPRAFCGIVFGSLPPYGAQIAPPTSASARGGFYIDYRKSKCSPFMSFDHGKAEVSSVNNAVVSVNLYSDGPDNGLSDAEYFSQVRGAIERTYRTKPVKTEGEGPMPTLTYVIADLAITLAPDPRGGFSLCAVNSVLQRLW